MYECYVNEHSILLDINKSKFEHCTIRDSIIVMFSTTFNIPNMLWNATNINEHARKLLVTKDKKHLYNALKKKAIKIVYQKKKNEKEKCKITVVLVFLFPCNRGNNN